MAKKKNQHYVPKMLLRQFGYGEENRQIDVFNVKARRLITGASVKGQCYRDYFYGTDGVLETHLSALEGVYATIIREAKQTQRYNPRTHGDLATFVSIQLTRTYQQAQSMELAAEQMIKMQMYGRFDEALLRNVRFQMNSLPAMLVRQGVALSPMLSDLKQFLVVNQSGVPFLISDTPVLQTNWFCRLRYPTVSKTGGARSGLQLFLPITPNCGLMLHDSNVYSLPAPGNTYILTHKPSVHALNRLQWQNAFLNIYAPPGIDESYLQDLAQTPRLTAPLSEFDRFDYVEMEGGPAYVKTDKDEYAGPSDGVTSEILRVRFRELDGDVRMPSLTIRPKPYVWDDGSAAAPARDDTWRRMIMEFDELLTDEKVKFSDLPEFVKTHPMRPFLGTWTRRPELRYLIR